MDSGENGDFPIYAPPLRIAADAGLSEALWHKARHKHDWNPAQRVPWHGLSRPRACTRQHCAQWAILRAFEARHRVHKVGVEPWSLGFRPCMGVGWLHRVPVRASILLGLLPGGRPQR
jgi:hypothetical protein